MSRDKEKIIFIVGCVFIFLTMLLFLVLPVFISKNVEYGSVKFGGSVGTKRFSNNGNSHYLSMINYAPIAGVLVSIIIVAVQFIVVFLFIKSMCHKMPIWLLIAIYMIPFVAIGTVMGMNDSTSGISSKAGTYVSGTSVGLSGYFFLFLILYSVGIACTSLSVYFRRIQGE